MARNGRSGLTTEERRSGIACAVRAEGLCSVNDLADRFRVTSTTIRTDLKELEAAGVLVRTYGGAMPCERLMGEERLSERRQMPEKRAIAERALSLIGDGDVIALDTGTTSVCLAEAIVRSNLRDLRIVSPDFSVVAALEERDDFDVIAIGGQVRHGFHFACGDMALAMLDRFRVDRFFLSPGAIDLHEGLTTQSVRTSYLKAKLMSIAHETVLISDSTKYAQVCFNRIAPLDAVSRIVVDKGLDSAILARLEELGREVLFA